MKIIYMNAEKIARTIYAYVTRSILRHHSSLNPRVMQLVRVHEIFGKSWMPLHHARQCNSEKFETKKSHWNAPGANAENAATGGHHCFPKLLSHSWLRLSCHHKSLRPRCVAAQSGRCSLPLRQDVAECVEDVRHCLPSRDVHLQHICIDRNTLPVTVWETETVWMNDTASWMRKVGWGKQCTLLICSIYITLLWGFALSKNPQKGDSQFKLSQTKYISDLSYLKFTLL